MKKRTVIMVMCMSVGISALSGCAKTPESSLVKQKGESSMKSYEEGDTLDMQAEAKKAGAVNEPENTKNPKENTAYTLEKNALQKEEENKLRLALNAPKTYKSEVSDGTGKLKIITDAVVEIPDADKVSAINVSQHPMDQTFIDNVTNTFFPDAKFYTAESWYARTKADWLKQLEQLKGFVAEGNLDPYGMGTDENGNLIYDIYGAIEEVQKNYENAPEKVTPVEVKPQYDPEAADKEGNGFNYGSNFQAIAVTGEGNPYRYEIASYDSMPMLIQIDKFNSKTDRGNAIWSEYDAMYASNDNTPKPEEVKSNIGISLEQAQKIADEKVEKLALPFMELTDWEYGILWDDKREMDSSEAGGYSREAQLAYGYILHYTRKINNIPITYTIDWGGGIEEMDSDMETWCYERLNFYITKDGISKVEFNNPYDIGAVKTENLTLKPFEEIKEIYEKMMPIQNADIINYESFRTYYVDRITFGYTRIYEPSSDCTKGLLVPAWNFFGKFEMGYDDKDSAWNGVNATRYQSYLTINAVDGSLIDMGLGY